MHTNSVYMISVQFQTIKFQLSNFNLFKSQEEYESKVGGISKILSTDDWIIGHLTEGPVLIWENSSSSYPHQLDVSISWSGLF